MHIILIAHAQIEKFANPETDTYDRYSPRLQKLASALVQEWCDDVLFATYRIHTKTTNEGFNRKRVQGIGTGERIIRTTERPRACRQEPPRTARGIPTGLSHLCRLLPRREPADRDR